MTRPRRAPHPLAIAAAVLLDAAALAVWCAGVWGLFLIAWGVS